MKKHAVIPQFDISPLAKAGIRIIKLEQADTENKHNVETPHRDNHYMLVAAVEGSYKLNLDFNEIAVTAPALFIVFPGQVHHIINISNPKGWAISFDPSLIESDFAYLLQKHFTEALKPELSSEFYQRAIVLTDMMEKLQNDTDDFTVQSLQSLLSSLLSIIAGKLTKDKNAPSVKLSRSHEIEKAFMQLLKDNYKTWKKPSQYASAIAITTSHLNDTIKALTGSPVSVHIQQASLLEAKRLLYFTSLSVKQIGYTLGYDEPVYFGKLFKKITNMSPLEFRAKFRD